MAPKTCTSCNLRLEQQGCEGHCRRCAREAGLLPPKLTGKWHREKRQLKGVN